MKGTITACVSLLAGAAVHLEILGRIFSHPASGSPDPEGSFRQFAALFAFPTLCALLLLLASTLWPRRILVSLNSYVLIAVLGPLLAGMGLAQYSHSTPSFMVFGILLQCAVLLRVLYKVVFGKTRK